MHKADLRAARTRGAIEGRQWEQWSGERALLHYRIIILDVARTSNILRARVCVVCWWVGVCMCVGYRPNVEKKQAVAFSLPGQLQMGQAANGKEDWLDTAEAELGHP